MTVYINDVLVNLVLDSLMIDDAIEERSICNFSLISASHYSEGQKVKVFDDCELIYAGFIDSIEETKHGNTILHQITCKDNHYVADKRIYAEAFESTAAGTIVTQIITDKLAAEGVIGNPAQPTFARNSVAYLMDGTEVAINIPRYETGKYSKALTIETALTGAIWANYATNEWSEL